MSVSEKAIIIDPEKIPEIISDNDKIIDDIIAKVQGYAPSSNTDMIYIAYRLAKHAHANQFRKSGAPYIEHPVQIAYIASELGLDATAISAALLHDVVEDTSYTLEDLATLFGQTVADIVDGVTKLKQIRYSTREEQQVENYRKMFLAMSKDIRVVVIKLIDRLHNMRTMDFMPHDKQLLISKETLDVYAPLAHRLGMSKIKIELEDLSLKYLDPVAFDEIKSNIHQKKEEREKYLTDIMEVLRLNLDRMNIKAEVTGRAKHFYSIFRKMYTQNKTLDQLYDLFAVRVIVNSVADCYAVLGMVHDLYKPMPMRFKDYIAMPKPNMYQSLHTTLIGPGGVPFEVQIRTWEMHKIAEEGIAAHWKYKEGISGQTQMDTTFEWVRQLLDTQKEIIDSDDFMHAIRVDLFSDEVFVFTPQGKVISLPAGSTVIDFAFAIHSQVGYKMSGAKVDGKIVPNNYHVKNGEIIEILTANTHGPSRDWLSICKTSNARNKINQWFKREKREENIEEGKEAIEKELRRLGNTHAQLFKPEWVAMLTRRYGFASLDDLYASIGYGGLTAQKVVFRLREEWVKANKEAENQKKLEAVFDSETNTVSAEPTRRTASSRGIVVKGIDNCLVRLAKCCAPVAGDDIVGFITKGRGVSVHRRDCTNIQPENLSEEDKNRFIEVWWDKEKSSSYVSHLQVEAPNRDGVLLEITNILANLKIPFKSVNAFVNKKGIAIIQMGVEIRNTSDLSLLIKKIKQVHGVTTVSRLSN
ncbi:MAG: bifunctional (p)ppGpp synthetase/guanosine-3',5'-bis(diphosphate) 3'-pyrophosphohydrolase [Clostridia bacterium]|nr:bifunctional (p)ppGpp synthetase/guanosine-3',5'-bis(diphosphate) 3'-pyrophosphohydrolase [Clostridia bacterium]